MGETKKKDQPTKRHRQLCGLGKSSSDTEIARGKGKERWPFPQSLTVDELARYRRRRVQGRPKDTLCRTEGSLGNLITEYRRAFRASSEDICISNGLNISSNFKPVTLILGGEQRGTFGTETGNPGKSKGPACNLTVADAEVVMEARTESSRFIPHLNAPGRPPQMRRGTSLKREGKFSSDTEQSCYVAHEGNHRAQLARRPTSLKMEGDMATTSENCDQFIEWLNVSRPELARLPTHLKLEGDVETSTENHDKYVPFVGARRPEILRQNANLRMEGESRYLPEYQEVFKDHHIRGRRALKKPETHLRTEGNFYNTTETSEQFVNPRSILAMNLDTDRQKLDTEDEDEDEELNQTSETIRENIERVTDPNEIKGPPLEIPEYRDAFKDFPRERPKLMKPGDEIGRSDGSKISSSPTRSKFNTKIDMDPEYKSKFLDLSKESPVYRKPPLALRPSVLGNGSLDRMRRNLNGVSPSRGKRSSATQFNDGNESVSRFDNDGARQRFFEATSEVKSQYIPYGNIPRVESIRMPANLQLEGKIDLQPEYRNAYCTDRNYQVSTNEPRMHRRRERSSSESRRRDNYWTDNNNGENFGRVNANDDQDAFQVLRTRVHEDSIVGKPPSGNRRSSLVNRPTSHVDLTDPSILRQRSPSPTYRLHVCNVDDEPRGFGRKKQSLESATSGSRVVTESRISPTYNTKVLNNHPRRSYSPSFGRGSDPTKSFVVIPDHLNNQNHPDPTTYQYGSPAGDYRGRNRHPVNHNVDINTGATRDQLKRGNKTPPNWMRPWYDNGGENVGTEAIVRVTHWLRGIWEMRRRGGPVQQWVDSIPSYANTTSSYTQQSGESSETRSDLIPEPNSAKDNLLLKKKLLRKTEEMTATAPISIPNSPAITMTCPMSSVPHSRLARDPSFQSDSSHCSSVESLLEWRKADPEAILLGLGFGYPSSPQENGSLARIPRRFLQPSKLKGIAVDDFLKQQQESSESLDSASLGYRGLTGSPYVAPSEIVQKIMERLREHESHEVDSFTHTNSSSELFGSMQQEGRLSVLSPDNRQYLERPRSKSPDMRNKRMIIGEKSFAFGYNGDLIEIESLNTEEQNFEGNLNDYQINADNPIVKSESQVIAATQVAHIQENILNEKPGKLSMRRLGKQLSFDEDNSDYDSKDTSYTMDKTENPILLDSSISEDQRDSLVTVISRWSENNETAADNCELTGRNSFDDTRSDPVSRRASDSLCDSKLKTNSLSSLKERRKSDSGIQTAVQRLSKSSTIGDEKKYISDKKPGLRRQARVSDDYEGFTICQNSSPILPTGLDDYISKNKSLFAECDDIQPNVSDDRVLKTVEKETWDIGASADSDDSKLGANASLEIEDRKLCSSNDKHGCCKNDELDQICEHEETSTECCCHASSSNCWRKMSKIMRKNQKLEDMVAKGRREMAELREMLNNVMSVRTEPGV